MITFSDALRVDHVALNLKATTPDAAVAAVTALLRNDPRVLDWAAFTAALRVHPPCNVANASGFGICIPHGRTNALNAMVMSAARITPELTFPACECPVRYIFCIGVPQEMASDYLRLAGALMRIFTDAETEEALHSATTRRAFLDALSKLERKL
jgi:PTS system nitrogen regulatory IIA component